MKSFIKILLALFIALALIGSLGCDLFGGTDGTDGTDGTTDGTDGDTDGTDGDTDGTDGTDGTDDLSSSASLSFDLSGAKAVGAANLTSTARGFRSRQTSGEEEYGLVKVNEDGTVSMAMEAEGIWMPEVAFIAKSPVEGSTDLYIAFEWPIEFWQPYTDDTTTDGTVDDGTTTDGTVDDGTTTGDTTDEFTDGITEDGEFVSARQWEDWSDGEWVVLGSFLHVYVNETTGETEFNAIAGDYDTQIKTDSWWGEGSKFVPIDFDQNGNLYYIEQAWTSNGSKEIIYQYNPITQAKTPLTPDREGFMFRSFEVGPSGERIFALGEYWTDTATTSFLRMWELDDLLRPANIYYDAENQTWVRGYVIDPTGSYLVMNGYHVRGIDGILKASWPGEGDEPFAYTRLFDNRTSGDWFDPEYWEYTDWEGNVVHQGLFQRINKWDTRLLMTDGTNLKYMDLYHFTGTYWEWVEGYYEDTDEDGMYYHYDETTDTWTGWDDDDSGVWVSGYYNEIPRDELSFIEREEYNLDTGYWEWIQEEIGTDIWFAADKDDPSAVLDYTSLKALMDSATDQPILQYVTWIYDDFGNSEQSYSDIPPSVADYYKEGGSAEEIFIWAEYWYQDQSYSSGALDAERIMEYLFSFYTTDVTFRFDVMEPEFTKDVTFMVDLNGDGTKETSVTKTLPYNGDPTSTDGAQLVWSGALYSSDFDGTNKDTTLIAISKYDAETDTTEYGVWEAQDVVDDNGNTVQETVFTPVTHLPDSVTEITDELFIVPMVPSDTYYTGQDAFDLALTEEPYMASDIGTYYYDSVTGLWDSDPFRYLDLHIVKSSDHTPAQTFTEFRESSGLAWLDFSNIGNLFFDDTGALWGIMGGGWWDDTEPKPIKLLDAEGKRDLKVVNIFSPTEVSDGVFEDIYHPLEFLLDGQYMYFRDQDIDSGGYPTGYAKILRFDYTADIESETTVTDVLLDAGVPDTDILEIVDYSIGNGFLYVTSFVGFTETFTVKVDVDTLDWEEISTDFHLENIQVF